MERATLPANALALALVGERKSTPLFQTRTGWSALSPDGRWLAYSSKESGLPEIYVVPLRTGADGTLSVAGGKWVVSSGGGSLPEWRGDGNELFFSGSFSNTLVSARLNIAGDHFACDQPQPLFGLDAHPVTKYYAVAHDGQRIFMTTYGPGSTAPITVTTNWRELINK